MRPNNAQKVEQDLFLPYTVYEHCSTFNTFFGTRSLRTSPPSSGKRDAPGGSILKKPSPQPQPAATASILKPSPEPTGAAAAREQPVILLKKPKILGRGLRGFCTNSWISALF